MATALWKRLDVPGHDAALLSDEDGGLRLEGILQTGGSALTVSYQIMADGEGTTRAARIEGCRDGRRFAHDIRRCDNGWRLDGRPMGLGHLKHLDLGFTPATNTLQLRTEAPRVNRTARFSVAWFDIGAPELVELPQVYRRTGLLHYEYRSPAHDFMGLLEFGADGFVRNYPGLWRREA